MNKINFTNHLESNQLILSNLPWEDLAKIKLKIFEKSVIEKMEWKKDIYGNPILCIITF